MANDSKESPRRATAHPIFEDGAGCPRGGEFDRATRTWCLRLTITAWRITKRRHARTAFSGDGARLYGGRWNSPGTLMVYVAESQALAVLEVLVHLDASSLLEKYVLIQVDFEDSLVADLNRTSLPRNWGEDPVPANVQ